jgi:site-specific recombinase XerD
MRGPRVLYRQDGRQFVEHHIVDLLKKVARMAELRINGPHILRHTFCSHRAMKGAPARSIQDLAGHRDLTTTQRYMHLSPNAIHDAIRLLEMPSVTVERGDNCGDGNSVSQKLLIEK